MMSGEGDDGSPATAEAAPTDGAGVSTAPASRDAPASGDGPASGDAPKRFPAVFWTAVLAAAAAAGAAVLLLVFDSAEARPAVLASAGAVWISGVVVFGLVAALPAFGRVFEVEVGPYAVSVAYFLGTGIRLAICLAVFGVGLWILNWPARPLGISLAVLYPPTLFVEAGAVGRYLWSLDPVGTPPGTAPGTPPGTPPGTAPGTEGPAGDSGAAGGSD